MARYRYTFFLDFKENPSALNVSDDTIIVAGDYPRQYKVTIPNYNGLTSSSSSSATADISISFLSSTPKSYNSFLPFSLPKDAGFHVQWGLHTDKSLVQSLLTDLGFRADIAAFVDSASIQTEDYHSLFISATSLTDLLDPHPHDDCSLLSRLVANKTTTASDHDSDNHRKQSDLASMESLFVVYGRAPVSASSHQKPTDLVIEAYWPAGAGHTSLSLPVAGNDDAGTDKLCDGALFPATIELGIFQLSDVSTPSHILYSGITRSLRSTAAAPPSSSQPQTSFQQTVLNYAPKHLAAPELHFGLDFLQPVGLHPKYRLQLHGDLSPPQDNCQFYVRYTIPKDLFLDRYQLHAKSFENTRHAQLIGLWGETDLENPVWLTKGWGSEAIVRLSLPADSDGTTGNSSFSFDLPMHSRYKEPSSDSLYAPGSVPWPVPFWACKDYALDASPDFRPLGYESLFPDDTLFYYATPSSTPVNLTSTFVTPVAPASAYPTIQICSVSVILAGVLYLLVKILTRTKSRPSTAAPSSPSKKVKTN